MTTFLEKLTQFLKHFTAIVLIGLVTFFLIALACLLKIWATGYFR